MRFYNRPHRHYCGIDLDVNTMYVCILDAGGQVLVHRTATSTPEALLETIAPYRDDLVVAAECMFTWYWLPISVQPRTSRSYWDTRDLLRRRLHVVRKRGQLRTHIQNTRAQYQLPELRRRLAYPANRTGVSEPCTDPSVRQSIDVDLALLERDDDLITDLELTIVREAKRHDGDAFHRLRSVPGIGKVLALTILYDIHDMTRFDRVQEFASYARLVTCAHQSAGKTSGTGGAKMGNVHVTWAFSEAAVLFLRHAPGGTTRLGQIEKQHGKGKALSILAHTIGRAVFFMRSRSTVLSMETFRAA